MAGRGLVDIMHPEVALSRFVSRFSAQEGKKRWILINSVVERRDHIPCKVAFTLLLSESITHSWCFACLAALDIFFHRGLAEVE